MQSINVGMILENSYPTDIRVWKEYKSLISLGYNVHLLCLSERKQKLKQNLDGLNITRIKWGKYKIARNLNKLLGRCLFRNTFWRHSIRNFVINNNINILHVHDLPLVNNALDIKKQFPKLKIILDLHENWAPALQDWHVGISFPYSLLYKYIHKYERWYNYEATAVTKVDAVIAVVDEMKQRLLNQHKIQACKIVVVPNYEHQLNKNIYPIQEKNIKQDYIIIYVGGLGNHRGLDVIIKGLSKLGNNERKFIKLYIIGNGPNNYVNKLKDIVNKFKLNHKVIFTGELPYCKVLEYMKIANVGLVPHRRTEHTDNTIPHKLFQYMMCGLPVIVSNCKPLERYVLESNSGAVYNHKSSEDFAVKLTELYHMPQQKIEKLSNNGKKVASTIYNWTQSELQLKNLYKTMH